MPLPRSLPGRIAAASAAAIVLLLVVAQLFVPGLGEGAIEERLTENGGVAEVSLDALPAARLLWGSGDELRVDASGLRLDLEEANPEVFKDLDRFGSVAIAIAASTAGPIAIDSFTLARSGDEPYSLLARGKTSAADMAEFFASDLPGSSILGGLIEATGVGGADLPLELDMLVEADPSGRIRVIDGGGEIAGIPTGPLAELITNAVVMRL